MFWPAAERCCGRAPGAKAVSIDPIWGGGLDGNGPPLAELAQLGADNGNAADGIREWVCWETGGGVYGGICWTGDDWMLVLLHREVICIPNRQTVVQWPKPPLSGSPVRCKGPSQGGFSVIRVAFRSHVELRSAHTSGLLLDFANRRQRRLFPQNLCVSSVFVWFAAMSATITVETPRRPN